MLSKLIAFVATVLTDFWAVAPDSLKGHLNVIEIARVVLTALFGAAASAAISAVLGPLGVLFAPANVAAFVALVQAVRLLFHGANPPKKQFGAH